MLVKYNAIFIITYLVLLVYTMQSKFGPKHIGEFRDETCFFEGEFI